MSTTVTYKGATLTTVENETKTLTTGGTWMEGDLTLTDVTQGGGSGDALYKRLDGTLTDSDIDWSQVPTTLKDNAFHSCSQLTTVGNPTVTNLPNSCFRYCSGLTSAEITATSSVQTYCDNMFRNCTSLQTVTIHFTYSGNVDVSFGANYVFGSCTSLQTIILTRSHATKTIRLKMNFACDSSSALRTMVLKTNSMVVLENGQNAYAWGGIWDNPTESTIYVPNALISSYQTATNWVTLYNRGVTFAKIEGSIYE